MSIIISDSKEILSTRIKIGEIELIFDTSALRAIGYNELEELTKNRIRMLASPYCAFEAIRHIDIQNDFDRYKSLLQKIDLIGTAHMPNYESSIELGIKGISPSKAVDKSFAAAISKYGGMLEKYEDVSRTDLINTSDGRRINFEELVGKMQVRVGEIHEEHTQELLKFKEGAVSFIEKNSYARFTGNSIPQLTAQVMFAFCSEEDMKALEIQAFMRYYPHIGAMLYKNFNNMSLADLKGFSPPRTDGVDYRVTLHLGMESQRILVSNDKKAHIDPLRAIEPLYDRFMKQFKGYDSPEKDKVLVISTDELKKIKLGRPLC